MMNKTAGVKRLVEDVIRSFSEPYNEDIIFEVCCEIENSPDWLRRYTELCDDLDVEVVNQWIGRYVKDATGLDSLREVAVQGEGHIISNYTKLGFINGQKSRHAAAHRGVSR